MAPLLYIIRFNAAFGKNITFNTVTKSILLLDQVHFSCVEDC